jgi:CHAT domain-containing protein
MREEADALSDAADYRAAAAGWERLAGALREAGGPDVLSARSAWSRAASAAADIREGEDAARPEALAAAAALAEALGPGSPEALFAGAAAARLMDDRASSLAEFGRLEGLSRESLGPLHPQTLSAMAARGSLLSGRGGSPAEGGRVLEEALVLQEAELGASHPDTLWTLSALAGARLYAGDDAAAARLYRRALAAQLLTRAPDGYDAAAICHNLSQALAGQGEAENAEAVAAAERGLDIAGRALGPDSGLALALGEAYASALFESRDMAGALAAYRAAAEAQARALGAEDPMTLSTLNNYGVAMLNSGDARGGLALLRDVLEALGRTEGPDAYATLMAAGSVADALAMTGDRDGSVAMYRRAADGLAGLLGPDHPDALGMANNLAVELRRAGDIAGARDLSARTARALEDRLGPDDRRTLWALGNLAGMTRDAGDPRAARELDQRVLDGLERTLGPGHPDTLAASANLAVSLHSAGDLAGAASLYRRSAAALAEALGLSSPEAMAAMNNLGALLTETGDWAGASEVLAAVLADKEARLGASDESVLGTALNLGRALHGLGDYAGALDLYRRAAAAPWGPDHPGRLAVMNNTASARMALGDSDGATAALGEVLSLLESSRGPDHPDTVAARINMASALLAAGDADGAERLAAQALASAAAALGQDHPLAVAASLDLALVRNARSDPAGAADRLARALERAVRVSGPHSPQAALAQYLLGEVHADMREYGAAVFWLKLSVESALVARGTMGSLDEGLRANYMRTVELRYQSLFDLLMTLGRTDEAMEVLDLLKDEELRSLDPKPVPAGSGDDAAAGTAAGLPGPRGAAGVEPAEGQAGTPVPPGGGVPAPSGTGAAAPGSDGAGAAASSGTPAGDGSGSGGPGALTDEVPDIFYGTPEEPARLAYLALAESVREANGPGGGRPGSASVPGVSGGAAGFREAQRRLLRRLPPEEEEGEVFAAFDRGIQGLFGGAAGQAVSEGREGSEGQALAGGREGSEGQAPAGGREGSEGHAPAGGREGSEGQAVAGGWEGREGQAASEGGEVGVGPAFDEGLEGREGLPGGKALTARAAAGMEARRRLATVAGEGTAVIYAVSAPRTLHLVMVTHDGVTARRSPVGRSEISRLSREFRDLVGSPFRDPRGPGARLYDALIRPLKGDLEAAGTRALALSLDGPLRYVPVAALWDGERWLVERYPTAVFTRATAASDGDGGDLAGDGAVANAMGVTAAWPGFPELRGVAEEIAAVVGKDGVPGVLRGEGRLDAEFDRRALAGALASGAPVLHVASHFRLDPGDLLNTALLLGDGRTLSLREIRSGEGLDFSGLDLLTLSACDTGSGASRHDDGREVESLGEIVQRAGARTVLATLMPVDDAATPGLMREFYLLRYAEGEGKAEALRGAQLKVMRNVSGAASSGGSSPVAAPGGGSAPGEAPAAGTRGRPLSASGARAAEAAPPWGGAGFSHPYFWAPFVIMGDWR